MIDEKKLIKERPEWLNPDCEGNEEYNKGWNACNKYWCNTIKQQPKVGDWITCSERLPSEVDFIASYRRNKYSAEFIVMIEGTTRPTTLYFRKTGIWVDENGNPYRVIAWQPLPKAYNPGTERMQTNGDRIRDTSATDEGLAELLYSLQYGDEKVKFCGNNEECDDILDSGGTIPDEMCKQCLVEWLQQEVEE